MPSVALLRARLWLGLVVLLVPAGIALAMGYQQRWLDDDGFINLRIVRNVLEGYGPVFNLDERVEAGTSPLWIAVLALLGALGWRLEDACVYTGIAFTGLAVLLAQDAATRLHSPPGSRFGLRMQRLWLPLGALTVAVLPPLWDYASSGLETGLSLLWLAASYDVTIATLRAEPTPTRPRQLLARVLLLGLGILIRPELTLYALGFLALLAVSVLRALHEAALPRRALAQRAALLLAVFAALPVSYQIFRMGYYGALGPNTALTKEAFLVHWGQGRCYLANFLDTYRLRIPLLALAVLLVWYVIEQARQHADRLLWLGALLLPPVIGVAHGLYVVRMGGDYMHGRMFLPALFALLLPLFALPGYAAVPRAGLHKRIGQLLLGGVGVVVLGWCWICGTSLRVPPENQCGIGDERGWYARVSEMENPVRLEDYEKHSFLQWGRGLDATLQASCPQLYDEADQSDKPGCRLIHLPPDEASQLYPVRATYPLARSVDPRVRGMVTQGAIGMAGFALPGSVHVADAHGLADSLVSRVELLGRGRPGHEKLLPVAWRLARFTAPTLDEDATVAAARHALHCGPLATLDKATRAPLGFGQFFQNIAHAAEHSRLRLPSDPFEAEARFCRAPPVALLGAGGEGGDAFAWRCSDLASLTRLHGAYNTGARALARIGGTCAEPEKPQFARRSPDFGPDADRRFELSCPANSSAIGIFGHADGVVHAVGLICQGSGAPTRSELVGEPIGAPFELACLPGKKARLLRGRAGLLIDGIGIGCVGEP